MPLIKCPDCGKEISDQAPTCIHCGRPMSATTQSQPPGGTKCPKCGKMITPLVSTVGGGSCSVGSRERWTCPECRMVIFRKGCFVATATYGDEDIIEVQLLRAFRDTVLRRSLMGRVFIWIYYKMAPYPAWVVERVRLLRYLARLVLDGIISTIERHTNLRRSDFRCNRKP
jgi:DNA-directed RNA polymerase subunit RPC12/RpoP